MRTRGVKDFVQLCRDGNWEAMEQIARKRPKLLHEFVYPRHHETPLQSVLLRYEPDPNDGIQRILRIDPSTVQVKTQLHGSEEEDTDDSSVDDTVGLAVRNILYRDDEESITGERSVLYRDYEESIPGDGLLAVHLAVVNRAVTLETLKLVVKAYPEGLLSQDTKGNTPLHYAFLNIGKTTDEKRTYLIEAEPRAAEMVSSDGSLPLHYAALYGTFERYGAFYELYEANEDAISHPNANGKIPLDLAVKAKHRFLARILRELDARDLDEPEEKAMIWVMFYYGPKFVQSRLRRPEPESDEEADNEDRKMPANPNAPKRAMSSFFMFSKPDPDNDGSSVNEEEDRKPAAEAKPRPSSQSIAEEAISLSLDWLSSSAEDLRSVGLVNKSLRLASTQPHLWDGILQDLEKLPLHPEYVFENDNPDQGVYFPFAFIDPRHCPDYAGLNSFEKATYLAQYRSMVLNYFRTAEMDEAGTARMQEILQDLKDTVREADEHEYFERWGDEDEEEDSSKPANVEESLSRCTLEAVKAYRAKQCIEEFLEKGISGYSYEVLFDGWEGIDFGGRNEMGWVLLCHHIGGLGVVMQGWLAWPLQLVRRQQRDQ